MGRPTTRARGIGAVGVAVAFLVAGACAPAGNQTSGGTTPGGTFTANITDEDAGPIKKGGKLSFGLNAETDGWNPAANRWGSSGYIVGFSIMEPLAAYDDKLQPQPYLAEGFEHNTDFTEWTIRLRKGVTFHDGTPVDADAIVENFNWFKKSFLTGQVYSYVDEGNFRKVDNQTVMVKMNKSWSTFPHILTAQSGTIAAPSMLNDAEGSRHPVGSGPFIFESWETNRNLKVKKNPNYWRTGFPHLDNIQFDVLPDVQSRGQALESGTVNIIETNDAQQILGFTEKAKEGRFQIFTDLKGDSSKIFVAVNVTKPPFDDPLARQAISHAADTARLSEDAYSGIFPPAYGPWGESSPFYADLGDKYPRYDPDKARSLAEEYQRKHGKPLEFTANIIPEPAVQLVAQTLQQQLAEVGITVNLASMEQAKLIVDALTGNYQATGFILFGSPHPDREFVFVASPALPNGALSLNFTRIGLTPDGKPNDDNKRIVDAYSEARKTDDPVKQKEQYRIVQEEMAKNLNYLFLVRQLNALVYDKNVHGALKYTLPAPTNATGLPTPTPFAYNLWLSG